MTVVGVSIAAFAFFYTPGVPALSQPQNGSDGSVQGFELNYQQAFRSLPSLFKNLGVQDSAVKCFAKYGKHESLSQLRFYGNEPRIDNLILDRKGLNYVAGRTQTHSSS